MSEQQLNRLGYRFLNEKKYEAAIQILKLNAEEHPKSVNVWDNLVDAYLTVGNYNLVKKHSINILRFIFIRLIPLPQIGVDYQTRNRTNPGFRQLRLQRKYKKRNYMFPWEFHPHII